MIAVLAEERIHPVVREFFELFKTPWEFYSGASGCTALICATGEIPVSSAKVVFVYGSQENSFDRAHGIRICSRRAGATVSHEARQIPIYGNCLAFEGPGRAALRHGPGGDAAAVTVVAGEQLVVRVGFDIFQEVEHLLVQGQPVVHAGIPTLELHIDFLRSLILAQAIPLVEIPPVPHGYNFIACLTHDMDHIGIRNHKFDHTMFGFLYRATVGSVVDLIRGRKTLPQAAANWIAALKLPMVHLGLAEDFWSQADRYLEIEKGASSTFFVIPKKGEPGVDAQGNRPYRRAASYDAAEHVELLKKLQSAGDEIGLHGIDAWRDSVAGRKEQEIVCGLTGATETGVRMHWLYFNQQSPAVLEAAGFSYDSTVGYNQTIGYRAGTVQVFKPTTTENLLELPMHVMDTALFYPSYLNLGPAQGQEAVGPLVANAVRFGGTLTVNWHDRSVAPERLWDATYARLVEQFRENGACFLTAGRAVSWFRLRRAAVFERDGEAVKVKIPFSGERKEKGLPGLRVRRHDADGKISETALADGAEIRLAA